MKFFSIKNFGNQALISLKRFPLTLLSALIGVVTLVYFIEFDNDIKNDIFYINIILSSALGIPFYIGCSVFTFRYQLSAFKKLGLYAIITGIIILMFWSLPNTENTFVITKPYIRYGILSAIVHLLVSFVPYLSKNQMNGFWNYNRLLFLRLLLSALFALVLFAGIAFALGALKLLFGIKFEFDFFLQIFVVLVGLFMTWFFVAGLPTEFESLEAQRGHPKGLKVFGQYILIPLLILYLVILYVYGGTIIYTWNWPKGIVTYLISCVSCIGIFTTLVVFPYAQNDGSPWLRKFSDVFYFLLVPLIVLLFFAIGLRISDYGLTIKRYAILALGIWISFITVYFIFQRGKIKMVPMSMVIILFLIAWGPINIFYVNGTVQVKRLIEILENNKLMSNGKIVNEVHWEVSDSFKLKAHSLFTNDSILTDSLQLEIRSILDYLDDHHGFEYLASLYSQNIDSMIHLSAVNDKYFNEAKVYMQSMGFRYMYKGDRWYEREYSFRSPQTDLLQISGYDYLIDVSTYTIRSGKEINSFEHSDEEYTLVYHNEGKEELLLKSPTQTIKFDVELLKKDLFAEYRASNFEEVSKLKLTIKGESDRMEAKIEFKSVGFEESRNDTTLFSFYGNLFLRDKN